MDDIDITFVDSLDRMRQELSKIPKIDDPGVCDIVAAYIAHTNEMAAAIEQRNGLRMVDEVLMSMGVESVALGVR